ncbi:MAG: methyltransferase domain-containing protein [Xanthobacteraceae bacterium]|nr:methyltransferase domain-containing protein [Xanthobacteraceae bacterium]
MMSFADLLSSIPAPTTERTRRVLNAGCGPRSNRKHTALFDRADWSEIRLDLDPAVDPDVVGSMTDMRSQFEAESFDAIWTSHSLEHLHGHEVPPTLAEFHRILRRDGFALITCPDLEAVMRLFLSHGPDHVAYHSAVGPITPLDMMFGHSRSVAHGNRHMTHNTGFTAERLGNLLIDAGFAEASVRRLNYDLWALALRTDADRPAILDQLRRAGLDMADTPR